jgi:hypothetical protein
MNQVQPSMLHQQLQKSGNAYLYVGEMHSREKGSTMEGSVAACPFSGLAR